MFDLRSQQTTLTEYLALPETNRIVELVDGEVIESPLPFEFTKKQWGKHFSCFLSSS